MRFGRPATAHLGQIGSTPVRLATAAVSVCVALGWPAAAACAEELRIHPEIIVPPILRLEVAPGVLTLPTPTDGDMAAGFIDIVAPVILTVRSNTVWELSARSAGDDTESGFRAERRPGRLYWRTDERTFADLTDEWTVIASEAPCEEGKQIRLMIRVPLAWTGTPPGDYELRIEYQLSAAGGR